MMELKAMYSARGFAQWEIEKAEGEFSHSEMNDYDDPDMVDDLGNLKATFILWNNPVYRLAKAVMTLTEDAGVCLCLRHIGKSMPAAMAPCCGCDHGII